MPNLVQHSLTSELNGAMWRSLPSVLQDNMLFLANNGWRFFLVEQTRGRCYPLTKEITIPCWVLAREKGKIIQYIAHECAHAMNFIEKTNDIHGPMFMAWMKRLCPPEYWRFELTYKKRNAKSAGVLHLNIDADGRDLDIW